MPHLLFLLLAGVTPALADPPQPAAEDPVSAPLTEEELAEVKGLMDEGRPAEALQRVQGAILKLQDHPQSFQSADLPSLRIGLNALSRLGRYQEVLDSIERALSLEQLQEDVDGRARLLRKRGATLLDMQQPADALAPLQASLALHKTLHSSLNQALSQTMNLLADAYSRLGEFDQALEYYEIIVADSRARLGAEHIDTQALMFNMARTLDSSDRLSEALPIIEEIIALQDENPSPRPDLEVAFRLGYGQILLNAGDSRRAVSVMKRALEVQLTHFEPSHPTAAVLHSSLSNAYSKIGHFSEAQHHGEQAWEMRKLHFGEEHPATNRCLRLLAEITLAQELLQDSLSLSLRALEIDEKINPGGLELGQSHFLVGKLYSRLREQEAAAEHFKAALEIWTEQLGPDHSYTHTARLAMSRNLDQHGDFESSLAIALEGARYWRETFGSGHPHVGQWYQIISNLYLSQGMLEEAMRYAEQALEGSAVSMGERHPRIAGLSIQIAKIAKAGGDLDRALQHYEQALAIYKQSLPEGSARQVSTLMQIGRLRLQLGQGREALEHYREAAELSEQHLPRHLALGSPADRQEAFQAYASLHKDLVALHLQHMPDSQDVAELALNCLLQQKNLLMEVQTDSLSRIREQLDPEGLSLLTQISLLTTRMEGMTGQGKASLDGSKDPQILKLEQERSALQRQLSRVSLGYRGLEQSVRVEQLLGVLPEDTLLLEWTEWGHRTEDGKAQRHYAVYLVNTEGLIGWRDLGPAAPIDREIEQLRRQLQRETELGFAWWGPRTASLGERLEQLLLEPIASELEAYEALLLSPQGGLSLLPFDLLLTAEGEPLGDRFLLTQLSSGRELLRIEQFAPSPQPPLIMAGVDFGEGGLSVMKGSGDPMEAIRQLGLRSGDSEESGEPSWKLLEGTRQEGEALHSMLSRSVLLTGMDASESALRFRPPPSLLHIATHGYFKAREEGQEERVRSGIVLAGGNNQTQGLDNGILSAEEISNLNLRGTELVVLSACETGLMHQEQLSTELQGLRSALVIAGSESQVLSLWKVSDEATQELMIAFYRGLMTGMGRSEALRAAKRALREDPRFANPYYWAGFVISGNWRPLESELTEERRRRGILGRQR